MMVLLERVQSLNFKNNSPAGVVNQLAIVRRGAASLPRVIARDETSVF
jgi:hypothetical protein